MAKMGRSPDTTMELGELDDQELEAVLNEVMDEDMENISLLVINPSKPGWKIYLYFSTDPADATSEEHADFEIFKDFPILAMTNFSYSPKSRIAMLTPLENCKDEEFSIDTIAMLRKYKAKAKMDKTKRSTIPSPPPLTEPEKLVAVTARSTSEILKSFERMGQYKPIITPFGVRDPITVQMPKQEFANVPLPHELMPPDDIVISIPLEEGELAKLLQETGCGNLKDLVQKLFDISFEEDLEFEHKEMDTECIVSIYRAPGRDYSKPMKTENMAFLKLMKYEDVGKMFRPKIVKIR